MLQSGNHTREAEAGLFAFGLDGVLVVCAMGNCAQAQPPDDNGDPEVTTITNSEASLSIRGDASRFDTRDARMQEDSRTDSTRATQSARFFDVRSQAGCPRLRQPLDRDPHGIS